MIAEEKIDTVFCGMVNPFGCDVGFETRKTTALEAADTHRGLDGVCQAGALWVRKRAVAKSETVIIGTS